MLKEIIAIIIIYGTIFSILYFAAIFLLKIYIIHKRKKHESNFLKTLSSSLKSQSIETLNEVINIYKGTFCIDTIDDSSTHFIQVCSLLRKFYVDLVNRTGATSNFSNLYDYSHKAEKTITNLIDECKKAFPYADLPSDERMLLLDINKMIENNELTNVNQKLKELSLTMQARDTEIRKTRQINIVSLTIAIIGIILTIFFGVISIILVFIK